MKNAWTDTAIRAAIAEAKRTQKVIWKTDPGAVRGKGALEIRVSAQGVGYWGWRYTLPDRSSARIPLGTYGDRVGELTLSAARRECDKLTALYSKPESRDVRAFLAKQEQSRLEAEEQSARDKIARQDAKKERLTLSVKRLLTEYVAHLVAAKKTLSARDAGNMFKNHVFDVFPDVSALPASDLSPGHVVGILRRLIAGEKNTTARKLRSYLRAAYALAAGAAHDPNSIAQMDRFEIKDNPVTAVKTIRGANVAGERTLSEPELKAYIKWLSDRQSLNANALLLALRLCGQRMSQLLRTKVSDVSTIEQTILLNDNKGRRETARKHLVPYGTGARQLIDHLLAVALEKQRDFLFVKDEGIVASKVTQTSRLVNDASKAMNANPKEFGLSTTQPFRMGDIRRTCETMLVGMEIPKDIRAQLLSHGFSGVQDKNYDKHDYTPQKRAAINLWELRLADIAAGKFKAPVTAKSKVTALRKTGRKKA